MGRFQVRVSTVTPTNRHILFKEWILSTFPNSVTDRTQEISFWSPPSLAFPINNQPQITIHMVGFSQRILPLNYDFNLEKSFKYWVLSKILNFVSDRTQEISFWSPPSLVFPISSQFQITVRDGIVLEKYCILLKLPSVSTVKPIKRHFLFYIHKYSLLLCIVGL